MTSRLNYFNKKALNTTNLIDNIFNINTANEAEVINEVFQFQYQNNLVYQQIVIFNFEFSHPDNEITNDRLLLKRKFVNCTTPQNIDTIELPEYTATKDYIGTFELAFKNGSGASYANPCFQNNNYKTDSLTYTFWLLDKNNVKSDSVVSPRITLKR